MQRFTRPPKKARRAANRPSQVGLVLAIGAFLGFAAFGIDEYVSAKKATAKAAAAALAAGDDEIYTGSILYMPDRGNLCRQLLFDNQSGQFTDNGYVDCVRATYRNPNEDAKHWSAARVRVISSGFRERS